MAEFQTPSSGSSSMPSVLPQPVQPGPAVGVDERLSAWGLSGRLASTPGSEVVAQDLGRGLDLPEQLLGFGKAAVVEVLDLNDVQSALRSAAVVGLDGPDGRQPVADPDGLADFGYRRLRGIKSFATVKRRTVGVQSHDELSDSLPLRRGERIQKFNAPSSRQQLANGA